MSKSNILPSLREGEADEAIQTWNATPSTKARNDVVRKVTRGWPPSRRAAQALRIRITKPWQNTMGPKTEEGKARCRMNARKHGAYGAEWKNLRAALREQRCFLKKIKAIIKDYSFDNKPNWNSDIQNGDGPDQFETFFQNRKTELLDFCAF